MRSPRFKYYMGDETGKPIPFYAMAILLTDGWGYTDVCGETLLRNGHAIPLTPDFKTWRNEVEAKRRCGRCWLSLRGVADLMNHGRNEHGGAPAYFPRVEARS